MAGQRPRLEVADVPVPQPRRGEALVRVSAAGLNRADLLQVLGRYTAPAGNERVVPGIEFAGVVEELGPHCTRIAVGRRVLALAGGSAHAEYVVSPQELLVDVPDTVNDVEAGATPEAFITVHDALVTQAGMHSPERVLVHAAASGVGLAALQLIAVSGCKAYGTVRTAEKAAAMRGIFSAMALTEEPELCSPSSFDEEISTRTGGAGADIILDPVGAPYFERNLRALAMRGRMVCIGTLGGNAASLDLSALLTKRIRLIGTVLRNRTLEEKAAATNAFAHAVMPLIEKRRIGPVIDRVFPLEQAADAYQYMQENRNVGKIVITMR